MKKSLLIAPVLGILLVAAAGSVGGTVAWFSASSSWETSVSSFKVARLDGNLDCTMVAGVRTTVTDNVCSVAELTSLTHASYDHANDNIYVIHDTNADSKTYDSKGNEEDALSHVGTINNTYWGALAKPSPDNPNNIPDLFYAVSWKMKFTYEWGGSYTAQNLYFDTASTITPVTGANPNGVYSKNTYKGFRIAFICGDSKFVWAPAQEKSKCGRVTGTNTTAMGYGDDLAYNASGDDYDLIANDADFVDTLSGDPAAYSGAAGKCIAKGDETQAHFSDKTTRIHPNYIGQMTGAVQTKSAELIVTCVAWFEGTDENVINASTLDTVSANLKFFSKPAAA